MCKSRIPPGRHPHISAHNTSTPPNTHYPTNTVAGLGPRTDGRIHEKLRPRPRRRGPRPCGCARRKKRRAHADAVPGPAAGRQRQTMVVAAPPRLARSLLRRPRAPLFIPSAGAGGRWRVRPATGQEPPRMSFCCSLGWVRPLPDRTASPHAAGRRGAATELIEQSLSLVGAGGRGEQTHPCCFNGGALL